jgi:hypothetical protein
MGANNPLTDQPCGDIDMSHIRILFAILSFWHGQNPVVMSIKELARRTASSQGGRYFRDLRRKIEEMKHYWIRIEEKDGSTRSFQLIRALDVVTKPPRKRKDGVLTQKEVWLDDVLLADDLAELLRDWTQLMHLRLDVIKELTSELAQAVYLFLPSRAYHHTKAAPFEIRLWLLFHQLGMNVPPSPSERKKLFTQNKRTVLSQLDGVPILSGRLRVALAATGDGSDYKLQSWTEKSHELGDSDTDGPLLQAWLDKGRSREEYEHHKMRRAPLLEFEQELLRKARVELENTRSFFSIAKGLIGENRFHALLSEAKVEALEGRSADNPTGALISRIIRAVATG